MGRPGDGFIFLDKKHYILGIIIYLQPKLYLQYETGTNIWDAGEGSIVPVNTTVEL